MPITVVVNTTTVIGIVISQQCHSIGLIAWLLGKRPKLREEE